MTYIASVHAIINCKTETDRIKCPYNCFFLGYKGGYCVSNLICKCYNFVSLVSDHKSSITNRKNGCLIPWTSISIRDIWISSNIAGHISGGTWIIVS